MRLVPSSELLKPGDIFSLKTLANNERVFYWVQGFHNAAMQIIELGGQNRDGLSVPAQDIPAPGEFAKWKFKKDVRQGQEDYIREVAKVLRAFLDDLLLAETLDAHVFWSDAPDEPKLTVCESFKGGAFERAVYPLVLKAIRPTLGGFDLDRIGALPSQYVYRDVDGKITEFDAEVSNMLLDAEGAANITSFAKGLGIRMYSDSYLCLPILSPDWKGKAVSDITGYIPGEGEAEYIKVFPTLQSAHDAVVKIHQSYRP